MKIRCGPLAELLVVVVVMTLGILVGIFFAHDNNLELMNREDARARRLDADDERYNKEAAALRTAEKYIEELRRKQETEK